jgi:hypothetical protein
LDYLDHRQALRLTDEQLAEVHERLLAPHASMPLSEVRQRLQRSGK